MVEVLFIHTAEENLIIGQSKQIKWKTSDINTAAAQLEGDIVLLRRVVKNVYKKLGYIIKNINLNAESTHYVIGYYANLGKKLAVPGQYKIRIIWKDGSIEKYADSASLNFVELSVTRPLTGTFTGTWEVPEFNEIYKGQSYKIAWKCQGLPPCRLSFEVVKAFDEHGDYEGTCTFGTNETIEIEDNDFHEGDISFIVPEEIWTPSYIKGESEYSICVTAHLLPVHTEEHLKAVSKTFSIGCLEIKRPPKGIQHWRLGDQESIILDRGYSHFSCVNLKLLREGIEIGSIVRNHQFEGFGHETEFKWTVGELDPPLSLEFDENENINRYTIEASSAEEDNGYVVRARSKGLISFYPASLRLSSRFFYPENEDKLREDDFSHHMCMLGFGTAEWALGHRWCIMDLDWSFINKLGRRWLRVENIRVCKAVLTIKAYRPRFYGYPDSDPFSHSGRIPPISSPLFASGKNFPVPLGFGVLSCPYVLKDGKIDVRRAPVFEIKPNGPYYSDGTPYYEWLGSFLPEIPEDEIDVSSHATITKEVEVKVLADFINDCIETPAWTGRFVIMAHTDIDSKYLEENITFDWYQNIAVTDVRIYFSWRPAGCEQKDVKDKEIPLYDSDQPYSYEG